ncbi:MAG: O-methyltransferase [Phycisphaerales bacterium]
MNHEQWLGTSQYLRDVFGTQDEQCATMMQRAVAAGLPDIAISADVGCLLMLLASTTAPRCIIEVGTLAGYSGIWLAKSLQPGGRLFTIEKEPAHAAFAQREFENAGVSDRVEIRIGAALDVLPGLADELGPQSVDVAFLDAIKPEYFEYWKILRPLIVPGGLLLADNVLGSGDWWITDARHPTRMAVDVFNRTIAADESFTASAVPIREGVLIARRNTR